jgi:DNA-binding Xre family transcriptional regulator
MLKLDLYRVFEEKGIINPHVFLRQLGFTSHVACQILGNKIESISFLKLEIMCLALNCTIDDLFNWKFNDDTGRYNVHVLQKLKRGERKGNIVNDLKKLPLDKLEEVRNYIEQLSNNEKTLKLLNSQ